jgi:hypothetical protein
MSSLPRRLFPSLGNQRPEKPIFLSSLPQLRSKTRTRDYCLVDCSGYSMHLSRPKRLRSLVQSFVNLQNLFLRKPSLRSMHGSMKVTSPLQTFLSIAGRAIQHMVYIQLSKRQLSAHKTDHHAPSRLATLDASKGYTPVARPWHSRHRRQSAATSTPSRQNHPAVDSF